MRGPSLARLTTIVVITLALLLPITVGSGIYLLGRINSTLDAIQDQRFDGNYLTCRRTNDEHRVIVNYVIKQGGDGKEAKETFFYVPEKAAKAYCTAYAKARVEDPTP